MATGIQRVVFLTKGIVFANNQAVSIQDHENRGSDL